MSLFELAFRYATPMRNLPNRWALVVGYLALSYFMARNSECHLAKNFMESLVDLHMCWFARVVMRSHTEAAGYLRRKPD